MKEVGAFRKTTSENNGMRNLGVLVGALGVVCAALLAGGCGEGEKIAAATGETASERVIPVTVEKPQERDFQWTLPVQGTCGSTRTAQISSRSAGTLDILSVGDGDKVEADEVLFQVDRSTLENNVEIQRQKLEVAKADFVTAKINSELAEAVCAKAMLDLSRAKKLQAERAISLDSLEKSVLNEQEAAANVEKTKALENYAQAKVEQEKSSLQIARKNLADSLVRAPFSGTVLKKQKDQNEYVKAGDVILTVAQLDSLEIKLQISANYQTSVHPGKTLAVISDLNGEVLAQLPVTYVAPNVDPLSRTFEIKIALTGRRDFVCGRLYNVNLILRSFRAPGVPNEAVVTGKNKQKLLYIIRDGRAEAVTVKTGIVDGSWTELVDPEPALLNALVVVAGQAFLNNGDRVEIYTPEK